MRRTTPPIQKVVVVNGNREVFGTLESVLESGRYDMVFVEPGNRAYSQVKAVQPDLVVLCTRIERLEGLQVLTMLKLDPETRDIPVLTYTMEYDEQGLDATFSQLIDGDRSSRYSPARRMN
jgi:CheY-like chemotaxis protein